MSSRAALLVVSVLAGATGPLPGIDAADHRVRINPAGLPWAAVARLQVPGVSRCTAVLVAPHLALTAAHCLYGLRLGHFVPPSSVHALLGYAGGGYVRHAVAVSYAVMPGFNPGANSGGAGADLALVRFAEPLADRVLPLAVDAVAGTALMLGGYGQDRAEVVLADVGCLAGNTVAGRDGRPVLMHDCAGTRGTSGGPVLSRMADGAWGLVGIQVAANAGGVGGVAVPVSTVRALLAAE